MHPPDLQLTPVPLDLLRPLGARPRSVRLQPRTGTRVPASHTPHKGGRTCDNYTHKIKQHGSDHIFEINKNKNSNFFIPTPPAQSAQPMLLLPAGVSPMHHTDLKPTPLPLDLLRPQGAQLHYVPLQQLEETYVPSQTNGATTNTRLQKFTNLHTEKTNP